MGVKLSGPARGGEAARQNAEINVTPFVDIMLVLLIIFMVAAPLATVSLRLDLPPPVHPQDLQPREPVYVTIRDSGDLYLGQQATTLANLSADACVAQGDVPDCRQERVFVRAEPEVPYDRLMQVMNAFQAGGFHKVGLLNEDIE